MTQKQNSKEALKCTYKDCQELQTGDGEFCEEHIFKDYIVQWEVLKEAVIEAQSEEDAIEGVSNGEVKEYEREITSQMTAFLEK